MFQQIQVPASSVPAGAEFGIYVSGDSMEPRYHSGQIVWVKRCEELECGDIGIFVYDDCGYLKKYVELGDRLIVESETCQPSGLEEARICMDFLKAQE